MEEGNVRRDKTRCDEDEEVQDDANRKGAKRNNGSKEERRRGR